MYQWLSNYNNKHEIFVLFSINNMNHIKITIINQMKLSINLISISSLILEIPQFSSTYEILKHKTKTFEK